MSLKKIFEKIRRSLIEPSDEFLILSNEIENLNRSISKINEDIETLRQSMHEYYTEISQTHYDHIDYILNEIEYVKSFFQESRPMLVKKSRERPKNK
jgi:chromosome segregation ATPase